MPNGINLSDITNAVTSPIQTGSAFLNNTISGLNRVLGPGDNTKYQFSYDAFPEDLGSSYYGHFMTMTAIVGDGAIVTPTGPISPDVTQPNRSVYSVAIFIPSAESGSGIVYEQKNEYTDIKVTNLAGKMIGAFSRGSAGEDIGSNLMSYLGHPINPGVEVLYRSTELREFQFYFLMSPQTEKESIAMQNIIKKLRMFAAPALNNSTNGILFNTPAEFEIKFYNKGQENNNIPKIRRCVLTDIFVDYTPQGEWSTFRNGHPVTAKLGLSFKEMEIIHRDFIEAGY